MADTRHEPESENAASGERAGQDPDAERAAERARAKAMRAKTVRWAISVVSVGSALFAIALALHIVFVIFDANPDNPLVTFVADVADGLVVFFRHLFTPSDDRLAVLVNYGAAAIFWLVVGRILIAGLRRIR